ncbi:fibronectin type III domain-containing protein [Spirillospora sp. NPDC127200]
MSEKRKSRRSAAAVATVAAAVVGGSLLSAPPAMAKPAELTVEYNCVFPLVRDQKIVAKIKTDIPETLPVNTFTPKIEVDVQSRVNADTTAGLNLVGAEQLEGTASASTTVKAPQGDLSLKVPISLSKTKVPTEGEFDIPGRGTAPAIKFNKPGPGQIDLGNLTLNMKASDLAGNPVDIPDDPDGVSMKNVQCTILSTNKTLAKFTITDGTPVGSPPTVPQNVKADPTETSATVTWDASTDPDGDLAGYEVYDASGKKVADVATATANITGLTPNTSYTYTVKAKDAKNNYSAASEPVTFKTPGDGGGGNNAPTAPQNVKATAKDTSATVTWDASTDQDNDLVGYEVYDKDGNKVAEGPGTSAELTGLTPKTSYTYTVKAKDAKNNYSGASSVTFTTTEGGGGGTVKYGYNLKGSTFVKAPNGTAPLTGTIDADLKLSTGDFTADLVLNPTKGDFKILGFLPVQAGIVLEPQGKTTGTLKNGALVADSKVVTKLPSFTLFGIPLGGGENCKTVKPSDIRLTSEGKFEPLKGGKLKGTYELSEIKDCNLLTPILSIFTAGKGNTIDLDLTPKPRT